MKQNDISGGIRNRIQWYNFILCLMVILIHSQSMVYFTEPTPNYGLFSGIETFVAEKICCWAVAGFYLCSGFLFYRNLSRENIGSKLKKRFFSLIVPFLTWNAIYYVVNIIMRKLPYFSGLFEEAVPFGGKEFLIAVVTYKYNPVFWFIAYLIIYTYLCPVIRAALKNKFTGLFAIAAVFFLSVFSVIPAYGILNSLFYWLFFYLIGAWLGVHARSLVEEADYSFKGAAVSLGVLAVSFFGTKTSFGEPLYRLAGACFIWFLLGQFRLPKCRGFMEGTFFVYAVHPMLAQFINKMASVLLGASIERGIFVFFLMPVFIVTLCYWMRKALGKYMPFFWRILSGGR